MKLALQILLPLLVPTGPLDEPAALTARTAAEVFREYDSLCMADDKRLWGRSLCGPVILVDPASRLAYSNQKGASDALAPADGGVFETTLPPRVPVAYAAVRFDGVLWAMLIWPLPSEEGIRGGLMLHEGWHRIQAELGIPATSAVPEHLNQPQARTALRLEWLALAAALTADAGPARERALSDALTVRSWRRKRFPEAASTENPLELSEGLAEYTGWRLAGRFVDPLTVADMLRTRSEAPEALSRAFAYVSGPAYGYWLDERSPGWRSTLDADSDLGALLERTVSPDLISSDGDAFEQAGARYGITDIRQDEESRAALQAQQVSAYRAKLLGEAAVTLPVTALSIEFDPRYLVPMAENGVVYPQGRFISRWGILTVTDSALLANDRSTIRLGGPAEVVDPLHIRGPGWHLELNEGWAWEQNTIAQRPGD